MSDEQLEQVYDAEISPLMVQIIAICKRSGISLYASFQLDGNLSCTTYWHPQAGDVDEDDMDGYQAFKEKHDPVARQAHQARAASPLMITTRNAAGDVISMEAIL